MNEFSSKNPERFLICSYDGLSLLNIRFYSLNYSMYDSDFTPKSQDLSKLMRNVRKLHGLTSFLHMMAVNCLVIF